MTDFELIPAIDLLGGRCVRLSQGRYDAATVYDDDPGAVARRFRSHPLPRLHVVDLDGAKQGRPCNRDAVRTILAEMKGVPIELGGGIRTQQSIADWIELGIDRVILGTAALRDPELVREAARRFPGRVAVGVDAKQGQVAAEGWLETSDVDVITLARRFEDAGVAALIHTDIARDGMGTGPNLEATAALAEQVSIPVVASGGVGSVQHIRAAAELASRGIAGVIVGRALYDGSIGLAEALEAAACS
ncbi:MAG: 1-(5-phosphoribosyl)-5-[(5-phosphoribosylamino)methylideneamino]imidazole-4-carboxamide isomerase [bacterium]|nr:1-(5-phosphoribosyl)-5-[(5-phosphoribosylamino)methylideneamino]imidazole-4-carboxamide isomerase [bacterium]